MVTQVYVLNEQLKRIGKAVAQFPVSSMAVPAGKKAKTENSITIKNPLLWGVPPLQKPSLYVAIKRLLVNGIPVDEYETRFSIRSVQFDPVKGVLLNGRPLRIQGVNQHHDLGALGAAFNLWAAERQLEIFRELGCNAIRLAHNPPAPELLDLTDRMGFLVIDEIFDCWERGKTPLDFHLVLPTGTNRTFVPSSSATAIILPLSPGVLATKWESNTRPLYKEGASRFRVLDRENGRLALQSVADGSFVTVKGLGGIAEVRIEKEEKGDASLFQWEDKLRGDLTLLSLSTHKYLFADPGARSLCSADSPGTKPDRKDRTCFTWTIANE